MQDGCAFEAKTLTIDGPAIRHAPGPRGCHRVVTSPVEPGVEFDDVIPSWNVRGNFRARIRVRRAGGQRWSRWRSIGSWGDAPARVDEQDDPHIAVDRVRATEGLDAVQLAFDSTEPVVVDRVSFCVGLSSATGPSGESVVVQPPIDLDVPFRSQHDASDAVARRICSPTCVAMLLAYHGIDAPTEAVAAACYDPEHDIYGNWNRAVQAAYSFGVSGWVDRFCRWPDVVAHLRAGRPIVASIAFENGALPGALLPRTDGHLVVIRGVGGGGVVVNDPAAPRGSGPMKYPLAALGAAWFGHCGVAYVFDGRGEAACL